jgi:hypothetical protein
MSDEITVIIRTKGERLTALQLLTAFLTGLGMVSHRLRRSWERPAHITEIFTTQVREFVSIFTVVLKDNYILGQWKQLQ